MHGRRGLTLAERSRLPGSTAHLGAPPPDRTSDAGPGAPPAAVAQPASDGAVRYQNPPSARPDDGGPVTLTVEQLGGEPVHRGARAVPVLAWVPWTDGRYRAVVAFAGEWTSTAVHLRWRESDGGLCDAWVWAAGVRRRDLSRD